MKEVIRKIIFTISLIVFVGSAGYLAFLFYGYWKDQKAYDEISKLGPISNEELKNIDEFDITTLPKMDRAKFDSLKAANPDFQGWIFVPGTTINYPIVKSKDNVDYLGKNFNGESNRAGAIFTDFRNNEIGKDKHTIVYGHNMKDGSMFATLMRFKESEVFNKNRYIFYYTEKGIRQYEIFSAYVTDPVSETYSTDTETEEKFNGYVDFVKGQSAFKSDVEVPFNRDILSLSTCAYDYDDARFVIHGVYKDLIGD